MSVETQICTADWRWFSTRLSQSGNLRFFLKELEKADDGIPESDLDYYRNNQLIDEATLAILSEFAEDTTSARSKWIDTSDNLVISWGEAERIAKSLRSSQELESFNSDALSALLSNLGIIRNEDENAFVPLSSILVPEGAENILLGAMNPSLRRNMLKQVTDTLNALEAHTNALEAHTIEGLDQVHKIIGATRELLAKTARKKWGVVIIAR